MPKFKRKKRPKIKFFRKKKCIFCADKTQDIDYKDVSRLNKFITERGKIISSRNSGVCARHQRRLVSAIKRARFIALLPFTKQ